MHILVRFLIIGIVFILGGSCQRLTDAVNANELEFIRLPEGFHIEIFVSGLSNARSMTLSTQKPIVYVGTRRKDRVYAVVYNPETYQVEKTFIVARGLNTPNGVAYRDGDLYIAEINRILRLDDIDNRLENPPDPVVIFDGYPREKSHGWKFIRFGPDGWLYVPVGAPCNVCESRDSIFATITRLRPDGSQMEIFARGVRNSVGFDWHPLTGELWFTDNGRDWLGDDLPPDELNYAPRQGLHFGFPYCHGGDIPDPEFGKKRSCKQFQPPAMRLGPHVAALGMRFYTGRQFPREYWNQIFIAEHGSWNRTEPIGYRVTLVRLKDNRAVRYEVFAEGWLQNGERKGRPVDVEILPDGSMLVSDDYADAIYRITYKENTSQ